MMKNLIFDFDGTLADTWPLIEAVMMRLIQEMNLPSRTVDEIKTTIGLKLEEAPLILWPDKHDIKDQFVTTYRRIFEEIKDKVDIGLFPGVKETLETLKNSGHRMAIATSRTTQSAEELTRRLGIRDYFDCVLGADKVVNGKPHPETVEKILAEMGWQPGESIMVGDMGVDIKMGRSAGLSTCGVTFGNGKIEDLEAAGADLIIDEFDRLILVHSS